MVQRLAMGMKLPGSLSSELLHRNIFYGSSLKGPVKGKPSLFFLFIFWSLQGAIKVGQQCAKLISRIIALVHGRKILPACRRAWEQDIGQFLVRALPVFVSRFLFSYEGKQTIQLGQHE